MPDEQHLKKMRQLRKRVMELNSNVVRDLRVFLNPYDTGTFERLPTKPPDDKDDIGVTVTCTCLMTAALTHSVGEIYAIKREQVAETLTSAFDRLLAFRWASSQLAENNAFTSALILRTVGVLCRTGYVNQEEWSSKTRTRPEDVLQDGTETELRNGKKVKVPDVRQYHDLDLKSVAKKIGMDVRENLRVGDYAANPAIGYWFFDAVDNLQISFGQDKPEGEEEAEIQGADDAGKSGEENDGSPDEQIAENGGGVDGGYEDPWQKSAEWACNEFQRQISLISANHHVLMDPVGMAMAACICKRLRTMAERDDDLQEQLVPFLPSETELQHGIKVFFAKQLKSGVWPKYFPMFHYPGAGANHCWSFEVLEALLSEFGELVDDPEILDQLCKAVEWCNQYRLTWRGIGWRKKLKGENATYRGWNSGGQQSTLEAGEPESWATGVVHMFLTRLEQSLAKAIRRQLFAEYEVAGPVHSDEMWTEKTIDTHIKLLGERESKSIRTIINDNIIKPITDSPDHLKLPRSAKRSVLLFGPPGTGKTRFVRAIAQAIGWHFLEINPSVFLTKGLEGIYAQTNKLFSDLRDLYRTVVFFDEMDAMLQARVDDEGKVKLTVEQQFLTTSMLPHLTELYDAKKVLFFVATNYGKTFDTAITRPGRFDMLLFLGPPDWKTKRDNIAQLATLTDETVNDDDAINTVKTTLESWVPDDHPREEALSLATFGEMRAMMNVLCREKSLEDAIEDQTITADIFLDTVRRWEDERFALCVSAKLKEQFKNEKDTSEIR
ncbi:MAG: AAA family ATPase [Planctomycetes bacterium]|nr:AAA family ATPase [Planctomycetota bacterium]